MLHLPPLKHRYLNFPPHTQYSVILPHSLEVTIKGIILDSYLFTAEFVQPIDLSMWTDYDLRELMDELLRKHRTSKLMLGII